MIVPTSTHNNVVISSFFCLVHFIFTHHSCRRIQRPFLSTSLVITQGLRYYFFQYHYHICFVSFSDPRFCSISFFPFINTIPIIYPSHLHFLMFNVQSSLTTTRPFLVSKNP